MQLKNVFFDFDGVIAESVNAKTDAFREMYLPYGEEIANKVVQYHINHGGVSRYEKFKVWEKTFFNKDITKLELEQLAQEFSNLVLDKVINSNEVSGVNAFLNKYSKLLNFWIITGTPTTEIEIIVNERNLKNHFQGVHGSPKNKRYWTEHLIEKFGLERAEILFLGDATTDLDAANFSKIHFALRDNEENQMLFNDYKGIRFKDFYELEEILKQKQLI